MRLIMGTGSTQASKRSDRYSGRPAAAAAQRAAADDRVGAQTRLSGGAVDLAQQPVESLLVGHVVTGDPRPDGLIDIGHRAQDTEAAVGARVAVAQFERLARPRRTPGGDIGTAVVVACPHVDLHGRIPSAVEDLPGVGVGDPGIHGSRLMSVARAGAESATRTVRGPARR
jgi:hypothetical protein